MRSPGRKRSLLVAGIIVVAVIALSIGGYQLYRINKREHWSRKEEAAREQKVAVMPKTIIEFPETKYAFGEIEQGATVEHAFVFRNAGQAPLLISKVDVSCGCTVTDFPKNEIPPGGSGSVTVGFNSAGKEGVQMKNVLVHSNGQLDAYSIGFTATVIKKK